MWKLYQKQHTKSNLKDDDEYDICVGILLQYTCMEWKFYSHQRSKIKWEPTSKISVRVEVSTIHEGKIELGTFRYQTDKSGSEWLANFRKGYGRDLFCMGFSAGRE